MAQLILPSRWRKQPTVPVGINWGHPLALKLQNFTTIIHGVPFELCSRTDATFTSGVNTPQVDGRGYPAQFLELTANDTGIVTSKQTSTTTVSNTFFVEFYKTVENTTLKCIASLSTSSFRFNVDADSASAGRLRAIYDGATDGNTYVDSVLSNDTVYSVAATMAGTANSAPQLYLDGSLLSPTSSTNVVSPTTTAVSTIYYGSNVGTAELDGGVSVGAFWDKVLSDAEIQALYENPYQFLTPIRRKLYFFSAVVDTTPLIKRAYGPDGQRMNPTVRM